MVLKLYLDDVRTAPDGWLLFRPDPSSLPVFRHLARHADYISFDHDLGLDPDGKEYPTGYDILCQFEKLAVDKMIWSNGAPELIIHSANPVGASKMKVVVDRIMTICGRKPFNRGNHGP